MGKSSGKKKKHGVEMSAADSTQKPTKFATSPRACDSDTAVFITMAQELKEDGNKLFQTRDCEGALLKYDKALKLLPRNHIDVAYLRSNMAACYMQMGLADYPRAVHECNLALEVAPKYSKALIKRARCYEGLNRLELALRDLNTVLGIEPNNLTALELAQRVKQDMETRTSHHPVPDYLESPKATVQDKSCSNNTINEDKSFEKMKAGQIHGEMMVDNQDLIEVSENSDAKEKKKKNKKKNKKKGKGKAEEVTSLKEMDHEKVKVLVEKSDSEKIVIEEKVTDVYDHKVIKNVKLVYGEDIRWAQLPENCRLLKLREVIHDRFPTAKAVLVKYKDEEGDMITITTDEELRWAESSAGVVQASVKLYIVDVSPEHDPLYEKLSDTNASDIAKNENVRRKVQEEGSLCIEEWIIQFAQLFKNYVGFCSDAYLDLHELGVKLYSEAMEETVSCDEAMIFFDMAAEKFQEMAALALFNWGNVHMARARKRIHFTEGSTQDTEVDQVKDGYNWAVQEYEKAGKKYVEALNIKPNFYEGYVALSLQQFEQAKLSWYYTVANNVNLDTWSPTEALDLYNNAEENIEKGMQIWEELEVLHQSAVMSPDNCHAELQKMGFDRAVKGISVGGAEEKATTIRSQINVLWGTMLYERSIMEFKLGLPVWQECLEVAVEKFELAGAPPTDITVMIKNHCSNDAALEGLGFRIDEIVQAWNDLDDAKRWYTGVPSFRLEPLLRRRVSKVYYALEHA